MLNKICVFILLIFSFEGVQAQFWMQRGGGVTIDEGMDIASDSSNNTYTTGYFTTNATFDNLSVNSVGLEDVFIVKTDITGTIQWLKSAGGPNADRGLAIHADSAGNIVVTGYFFGTAIFDGQSITSQGQKDIFIAKYNTSGVLLWVKSGGGSGNDIGNDVSFDNAGNVIVTGEFSGTCSFGSFSLISQSGSIDIFTAKYDSNGNPLWVKKGSAKYTDRGTGIAIDASNNIYVSGMFSDTITFDNTYDNPIFNAMFLVKYNSSGVEQWVRWMGSGSSVYMGGLSVHNNDINITGNFQGTLYFIGGTAISTLNSLQSNNIFVCRYDLNGNLIWTHADGSTSDISAEAITTNDNGEINITGNFKCRLTSFSNAYGNGVFCSVGNSDTYVSSYDNNGNWMWARQSGGTSNDFASGITNLKNRNIVTTGSYQNSFNSTFDPSTFSYHGQTGLDYNTYFGPFNQYCTDQNYEQFLQFFSYGNSDVFINSNINLARQPYDFFERSGTTCSRPFNDICIKDSLTSPTCPDTIRGCGGSILLTDLNIVPFIGPNFSYLWSNGVQNSANGVSTSGLYSVTVTSEDGCFSNQDSVYFVSNPLPPVPTISDSKGFNTNASGTIPITFCAPDSVILTCTNVGSNSVRWSNFPLGQNPITAIIPKFYTVSLVNQNGCVSYNDVRVNVDIPFQNIQLQMRCLEDVDNNDTISICQNQFFTMMIYDQYANPGGLNTNLCISGMTTANWLSDPQFNYSKSTTCPNNQPFNYFYPTTSGTFTIPISAWIVRKNLCDTDSVYNTSSLTIIVNPAPSGSISVSINGPTEICPGDSVLLIASPSQYDYQWTTGELNDSIYVSSPNLYGFIATETITNSFGCTAILNGYASLNVGYYPQPVISMFPASGLICPSDSVNLISTGTGSCLWQGPNGMLPSTSNSVFVNVAGFYNCIQTVAPGCNLVSNTQEVVQYNTPFLYAFPTAAICNGDSVEIDVVTNFGSTINWLWPLSGNSLSQIITTPGIYVCNVSSCNVITFLSMPIHVDSALAEINTTNNMLQFCEGDSLTLNANVGMTNYLWLPSGDTTLNLNVNTSGIDTLITTSQFGCKDTASINITELANNLITPTIPDASVCPGDSVLFNLSNPNLIHWSLQPNTNSTFLIGNIFQTTAIFTPISYYFYLDSGLCKSDVDSLNIFVKDNLIGPTISDSSVCSGDSILFNISSPNLLHWSLQPNAQSPFFTGNVYQTSAIISPLTYYFYLDSGLCKSEVDSINISVKSNLIGPTISDSSVCSGDSILFNISSPNLLHWSLQSNAQSSLFTGNSYQTSAIYSPVTYYFYLDSGLCKSDIDSLHIFVNAKLMSPSIPDSSVCSGDSILFKISSSNLLHWSLQSNSQSQFYIGNEYQTSAIVAPVTYYIYLDSGLCKSKVNAIHVSVKDDCNASLIPNIFTPNNDGVNDFFPGTTGYKNLSLKIFNRWGKIIYNDEHSISGWDGNNSEGKEVPEGTYYFVLDANYYNNTSVRKKGYLTLVR